MQTDEIFDDLRSAGISDLVGGGDPKQIGGFCKEALDRIVQLDKCQNVLDFGCGIGRVSALVAAENPALNLIGSDIVPKMIELCNTAIQPRLPNTKFVCTDASNHAYDRFKADPGAALMPEDAFFKELPKLDLVYAFSVFTHLSMEDWRKYLAYFKATMALTGMAVLTAFLIDDVAEEKIKTGTLKTSPTVTLQPNISKCGFYQGHIGWPTVFVGVRLADAVSLLAEGGFVLKQIEFGTWRNKWTSPVASYDCMMQDVLVAYPA